ncbi:putative transcription factor C3H family [Helianthus anomalus]
MVGAGVHDQQQLTEEEEFLKRNTDCVYFLASPLTCKKGSECEYRHSDIARVNPRDCWYWLNGNCLNPKCAFRHPPLDGLLGAEVPTPVGPAAPQAPVKQGVACIFFQKGFCLKGHLCPFWHGLSNVVNTAHPVPSNPVTKSSNVSSAGPEKTVQQQKFTQQENVQKAPEFPPQRKPVPRVQLRNCGAGGVTVTEKKVAPQLEETPKYKQANVVTPPVVNELPSNRSNHSVYEANNVSDNEGINGKEVDEFSREPTPGFDVLVDTELGDSEYYPNEEQFGRSRGHDYDMGRSVDYDVDHNKRDFDHYNNEGYAWEDRRESSGFGRTRYPRDESPDQFDRSDLRHQLSKQRRDNNVGGLRSVISREHPRDNHTDRILREARYDQRHDRRLDSGPLSGRFRGRIKIPGSATSPGYEHDSRVEREIDMGRQRRNDRVSSNNGRFRDRIRGRSNDDFNEGRDYRGYRGNDREFTRSKRWSDLKSQQIDDGQTLGKRKPPRTESQQFEGPKPLSEILKRKRESVISSVNNEVNNSNEYDEKNNQKKKDNPKSTDGQASSNIEVSDVAIKVGSIDEDAMLDQELEAYDHRDGDYDYEQIDGEDYNLEEGEEYMEEGDETGKKESEVYS